MNKIKQIKAEIVKIPTIKKGGNSYWVLNRLMKAPQKKSDVMLWSQHLNDMDDKGWISIDRTRGGLVTITDLGKQIFEKAKLR